MKLTTKNQQIPKAWIHAGTAKKEVTSRIDMSAEVAGRGLCPECKKPMTVAMVGASKMWACAADRITLPLPDDYNG